METLTTRTIKTPEQYKQVMDRIETLMTAEPNTAEFELLEVLSILADEYEKKNCTIFIA